VNSHEDMSFLVCGVECQNVTFVECQNITLVECQNITLVECQNITFVECQNITFVESKYYSPGVSKYYFEYKYARQSGVECIGVARKARPPGGGGLVSP
jgi:hypothetical protein